MTEADVLASLLRRYNATVGPGPRRVPRYVCATHVRIEGGYASSFGTTRTCDFLALDTTASRDYVLHVAEVKVSRADWLSELRDPEKARTFTRHCDYWWLAVGDATVTRLDELPEGWGLLVRQANGTLRERRPATRLTPPTAYEEDEWGVPHALYRPLARPLVAMFLRRAILTERERTEPRG